ncbi:MAG TPA: DNA/RNA non-specific endonuclease [Ignavibacteria bacterium]|nr:DNA/RNA non-specific endonuclease [Ignavibacteria bacterium]
MEITIRFDPHITVKILIVSLILFLSSIYSQTNDSWMINVELGIPTDSDPTDDFLIKRKQYVISYNKNKNVANWASWNLNKKWYGKYNRVSGFKPEYELPNNYHKVTTRDYTNTGYDRGHIVASKDRSNSTTNNKATFLMSNIYPQEPDLNQGPWKQLEEYCRKLCLRNNKELYVIAGGVFSTAKKLDNDIAIPDSCYKIIVILRRYETPKAITENTEVIAVMMPNESGIKKVKWETYETTVDNIEISSGYDFFSDLPTRIQDALERK